MFANTLTVTINAVAKVMTRLNQDNFGSVYGFTDATESIRMTIRHSLDKNTKGNNNLHNVFIERTIFATPTAVEKYWACTVTLRDRVGSGPTDLLQFWQGFNTLFLTLDDTFVVGEN